MKAQNERQKMLKRWKSNKQSVVAFWFKVEKILKGSLDSISSSVKIQIMGGKVYLRCKAKHFWVLSTNFWKQKVC